MPKTPSTTSIPWRVERSGGVYPILFETPSDPESSTLIQLVDLDWGESGAEGIFQWSGVDATTDGQVRFKTTVDILAPNESEVSEDAWNRMLCFFVVGRLSGRSLAEASQSLADIYLWQLEQAQPSPQIPEQRRHEVSGVRRVEKAPFAFDED